MYIDINDISNNFCFIEVFSQAILDLKNKKNIENPIQKITYVCV